MKKKDPPPQRSLKSITKGGCNGNTLNWDIYFLLFYWIVDLVNEYQTQIINWDIFRVDCGWLLSAVILQRASSGGTGKIKTGLLPYSVFVFGALFVIYPVSFDME